MDLTEEYVIARVERAFGRAIDVKVPSTEHRAEMRLCRWSRSGWALVVQSIRKCRLKRLCFLSLGVFDRIMLSGGFRYADP